MTEEPQAGAGAARDAGAARGPGTLYVVATPIGNLADISLRALEVLRSVAVVAAEDTRHTRRLWGRYDIDTPLVSYHAHSHERHTQALFDRLEQGDDVALVSDAGTPLVSDPGEMLVTAWSAAGGTVVAIPGASSVLAALVSSGIPAPRWGFEGFLPRKGRERKERIARVAADERATVLFESPGRTLATLRDLADACGGDRRAAICRELTKRYEEVRRGRLDELIDGVVARPIKGEVSIVIAGATVRSGDGPTVSLDDGRAQVEALVADGQRRSEAAKQVAKATRLARRDLFATDHD